MANLLNKMHKINARGLIVAASLFSIVFCWMYDVYRSPLPSSSNVSSSLKNFNGDDIDDTPVPLEEWVLPLEIRKTSPLNAKEMEYYQKSTWDPSKTLEQNKKILVDAFMKTCVDPVEDFLPVDKGIILKLASQQSGIMLQSAEIEEVRRQDLVEIFYLMTDSPTFCQLMRAFLAKYRTMPYRPQRALFLITKGEANHSSYSALHYVLNIRTMNHMILSALDCTKHKLLFGGVAFHEMLHWYHKVSDPAASEKRSKSTNCISRRLGDYKSRNFLKIYGNSTVRCFSNDEEYYTIYGLKEEDGELVFDSLCEATYTYEQYGYIRGSHTTFRRFSDEKNFILGARDSSLLKFVQNTPLPKFGKGEFKCSDLNDDTEDSRLPATDRSVR
ncbi:MAG: hypothetical protein LBE95_00785 [Holosporaceae bacterium]|jgi:hypothetical protein|nr:hypothetical protein [Holosporaceae bacterium]